MSKLLKIRGLQTLFALGLLAFGSSAALAQSDQQKLVNQANTALANFLGDSQMSWLKNNIGRAKAVLVAPSIVKAGFIFGGSGGRGVLFAHNEKSGKWLGPAFYTLATASVGFQAGVDVSESVTLVMTEKGLNSLLAPSVKVGGDVSVSAGPVGAGAKSDVTTDFVTYTRSKGVYGGLNLDGTVIAPANDWNEKFFGKKPLLPPDILLLGKVHNPGADAMARTIAGATGTAKKK
jgi:SH3 domain-containing YSC84-like protein 1